MIVTTEIAEILLAGIQNAEGLRELFAAFNGVNRAYGEPLMRIEDFRALGDGDRVSRAFSSACHTWANFAKHPNARRLFALCESRALQLAK